MFRYTSFACGPSVRQIYHFLEVFFTHDIESFKSVKYIYLKTIKNRYTSFACGPSYVNRDQTPMIRVTSFDLTPQITFYSM